MKIFLFIGIFLMASSANSQNWPLGEIRIPQFEIIKFPKFNTKHSFYYDKSSLRIYYASDVVGFHGGEFYEILTYRPEVICLKFFNGVEQCQQDHVENIIKGEISNPIKSYSMYVKKPAYVPPIKESERLLRINMKVEYTNPVRITESFITSSLQFDVYLMCSNSGVLVTSQKFYSGNFLGGEKLIVGKSVYVRPNDKNDPNIDLYRSISDVFSKYC